MACSCSKRTVIDKRPDSPCIYCAHKHIAAARTLYDLEPGYRSLNRSDAIGNLILAAWHLQKDHFSLAMECRECWLLMERGKEARDKILELQSKLWNMIMDENEKAPSPVKAQ